MRLVWCVSVVRGWQCSVRLWLPCVPETQVGFWTIVRQSSNNRQTIVRQSSGDRQTIVRQSSGNRQAIVRQSAGNRQTIVRQSSDNRQTIVRQSSDSRQTIVRKSTGNRQAIVRQSSDNRQTIVRIAAKKLSSTARKTEWRRRGPGLCLVLCFVATPSCNSRMRSARVIPTHASLSHSAHSWVTANGCRSGGQRAGGKACARA